MNIPRPPIWLLILVGAVAILAVLILSGRITWFSTDPPVEFVPNMDHQFKAIPQSGSSFFSNKSSLREPIPGTVARNVSVYPLAQGDVDLADSVNVDPNYEKSEFVIARGQNRFNVFCAPCHNYNAKSDSNPIVKRGLWPGIPDLTRPETAALTNGRIFHIISAGQNLMPSYADKVSPIDRWAIIYYLRTLQQAATAGE
ncbi:MAG: cytochrome c [Bradyrhizobiaceae bacterium]|nr:cytochrome c [Bradyrhizobiaceae bacterium]